MVKTILQFVSMMEQKQAISLSDNTRANEILEVILAFARQDFDKKVIIRDDNNLLDGIGSGVNMLGEELQHSTISLREKEQLLKEIHHRVKNNMQIISSLLNLQSDNIVDTKVLSLLRESRNRINSMALVHEMLYKSNDLSKIGLRNYIESLTSSIRQSYASSDADIVFEYDISEEICFDIDKMIPIGLILNEVISNSLKYAFPDKKGKIDLVLKPLEHQYILSVSDNGIGFKSDFDVDKDSQLGIQLIYMLTEQLNGTLTLESKGGVCYSVLF
ncbi:MAG: sensor histidine kinase [Bacteroidetes bacterium]|nr:sensor histidine kinase [Bacteroidota bacterium]